MLPMHAHKSWSTSLAETPWARCPYLPRSFRHRHVGLICVTCFKQVAVNMLAFELRAEIPCCMHGCLWHQWYLSLLHGYLWHQCEWKCKYHAMDLAMDLEKQILRGHEVPRDSEQF